MASWAARTPFADVSSVCLISMPRDQVGAHLPGVAAIQRLEAYHTHQQATRKAVRNGGPARVGDCAPVLCLWTDELDFEQLNFDVLLVA